MIATGLMECVSTIKAATHASVTADIEQLTMDARVSVSRLTNARINI